MCIYIYIAPDRSEETVSSNYFMFVLVMLSRGADFGWSLQLHRVSVSHHKIYPKWEEWHDPCLCWLGSRRKFSANDWGLVAVVIPWHKNQASNRGVYDHLNSINKNISMGSPKPMLQTARDTKINKPLIFIRQSLATRQGAQASTNTPRHVIL